MNSQEQIVEMKHLKTPQELNEASENLNISDVIERLIQDKSKEYVDEYKFDNMKEEGIAYSAFLAGCRYIIKKPFDTNR
jgi:hypothetical protein